MVNTSHAFWVQMPRYYTIMWLRTSLCSSENGMYEPGCGLDNVLISWGHDEYLYRVLKHNKCTLPEEGLAMIR